MGRHVLPPPGADERTRIRRVSIRFGIGLAALILLGSWIAQVLPLRPGPELLPGAPDPFSLAWVRRYLPFALLAGAIGGFLFSRMTRFPVAAEDAESLSK